VALQMVHLHVNKAVHFLQHVQRQMAEVVTVAQELQAVQAVFLSAVTEA